MHACMKLFTIGKDLITYGDEKELADLVKFYLDAEDEREEIALKSVERAYREHTYQQRMKALLSKS